MGVNQQIGNCSGIDVVYFHRAAGPCGLVSLRHRERGKDGHRCDADGSDKGFHGLLLSCLTSCVPKSIQPTQARRLLRSLVTPGATDALTIAPIAENENGNR